MNLEISKSDGKGKATSKGKMPFFDVQLFDVTKGIQLDPELREVLASKLHNLSNMYENKFRLLASKAENLEDQVKLMNQL